MSSGRELICKRTAKFFKDGEVVNLGIGMPTQCTAYLPEDVDLWIDTENGAVGLTGAPKEGEPVDLDTVDASGHPSGLRVGSACFDSFTSFGYIRGGHVDYSVLGAYEVDQEGSLANWMVPGKTCAGMGGAMDLVSGAKSVIVMTDHCDKKGNPKIVKKCTLPLTGYQVVTWVVTEKCVLHVTDKGMVLEELAPGETVEDVVANTGAELIIPEHIGCME